MKNLILLILTSFLLISCDNDDSPSDEMSNDAVIGKWVQIARAFDGVNDENLDECELMETIEFKSNNIVLEEDYDPDFLFPDDTSSSEYDGCKLSKTIEYTWTKNENVYQFSLDGETAEPIITFENGDLKITFEEIYNGATQTDSRTFRKIE
ncbi:lipocalin family protein [Polaribacter sp. Z014]|uniref:lipocalin family protein n=1 Tax=unclassified Polaribacter TaxID=196858 RepID=UPI00193BF0DD|nr:MULTISPECIES: lipocalin family protein [unclassified Polaribacter]MCL7763407.1 lipocalin family protein [Polaribacter sp. Z014]QVY66813.1 lipocalin family protein [Polaribacter sp. Q13]